jgi:hypothetical protein
MIAALSLLIVSFLAMMGMIYFKSMEIRTGRNFLSFGQKSDSILESKIVSTKTFLQRWNWRTVNLLYHFVLERVENFFLRITHYVMSKFSKQVRMVKGQGSLAEEKPSSSFFLKNIEEHKNNLNGK